MSLKVLDLSAGRRSMWFDKEYRDAVFVDLRPEVNPTVVADTRCLPPAVGDGFGLVLFDPPHVNFGANGVFSPVYGHHTTADIRDTIRGTAAEAHRVSAPDALMVFKWNNHDQGLTPVLDLMDPWWERLFGQITALRANRGNATFWVVLRRRECP